MARLLSGALFSAALVGAMPVWAQGPAEVEHPLATLRTGHPRVLMTPESLAELRRTVAVDDNIKPLYQVLLKKADALVADPKTVEYVLEGPRLLTQSRRCLDRVTLLALAYRLTDQRKYADRAIAEMLAAAAFPDWHPSHFLDTAEMTCAVGLGYDWLYDALTPEQRTKIKTAILTFGLVPAEKSYDGSETYSWWTRVTHNWNLVCNGGIAVGALAIADEEPQRCEAILKASLRTSQGALHHFSPEGGWDEGPGYWGYTTQFTTFYLAGLQTALGKTFGLEENPSLAATGLFPVYFTGPTRLCFNFADAWSGVKEFPQMFWLSRQFQQPAVAWWERQEKLSDPMSLLWFNPAGTAEDLAQLPLDKAYRGIDVAFFRSQWNDPKALWVGFKGGDNGASHSHLDLGNFVLDALGQRWALDLGPDHYNLPGYFGKERWNYYRLQSQGHNTLTADGPNQSPKAKAALVAFASQPQWSSAIADLTPGYPAATAVRRGVAMVERKYVLVQDEWESKEPAQVVWNFHTKAKVDVTAEGREALLSMGGAHLRARIVASAAGKFVVRSAKMDPPQTPNDGVSNLTIEQPAKVTSLRLVVALVPGDGPLPAVEAKPLATWPGKEK